MITEKRGFTLIELLIVIAIIAILATAVLIVLNPAQILAEARDTQRLSDLDAIRSSINFVGGTTTSTVATLYRGAGPNVATTGTNKNPFNAGASGGLQNVARTIDGLGWASFDFSTGAGAAAPISSLPTDPKGTTDLDYFYSWKATSSTFELDARLESSKHRDKMVNDGGNQNTCTGAYTDLTCWYEVGTTLTAWDEMGMTLTV